MDKAKLIATFPRMIVRNRRNTQATIAYENGDSITLMPSAQSVIGSAGLLQIPDPSEIELVSPTIFELADAGVITFKKPEAQPAADDGSAPRSTGRKAR